MATSLSLLTKLIVLNLVVLFQSSDSFVLSAGLGDTTLFNVGYSWKYHMLTKVLLNNKNGADDRQIGFALENNVLLEAIWGTSNYERVFKVTYNTPAFSIRSKNSANPSRFKKHPSTLDTMKNSPFYIFWNHGKVDKVLLKTGESNDLVNLKKGFANLLQFQLLDVELNETDISGQCHVQYNSLTPTKFSKTKENCQYDDLLQHKNPELLLSSFTDSYRSANYELNAQNKYIKTVDSSEKFSLYLAAEEEVGNQLDSSQKLVFLEEKSCEVLKAADVNDVLVKLLKTGNFKQESLVIEREIVKGDKEKGFTGTVNDLRESLSAKHLGSLAPTKSFVKLVTVGRKAMKEDFTKCLGVKKNQKILHQLYDILGFIQTEDAHVAVMKKLHFDDAQLVETNERYLWANSISSQPNVKIIADLLNRYKKEKNIEPRVKQTLIASVASMACRLVKLPKTVEGNKIHRDVEETILNELDLAKGEARYPLLHALFNLKSPNTIPTLLKIATSSTLQDGVYAWKALRTIPKEHHDKHLLKTALRTFLQLDRKHDTSSRTLALDIILESELLDEAVLMTILGHLKTKEPAFEVQQYLVQRVRMLSESCVKFREMVRRILKGDVGLNNYSTLGVKGLSTALTRQFLNGSSSQGNLLTVQEINSGIVKRGIVNVEMKKDGFNQEIFSLGVFSGGLGSLLSSSEEAATEEEVEEATAGMELSILGTQIRKFTFFNGQSELMGHVWSGTASEKTTAFQALAMLQDHHEFIRLSSGFIVDLDVKGVTSFDLSGQIEFSLWNRNAVSLVEKSAGILVLGEMRLENSFVKSQVEFTISSEPKLNLQTDVDFYSGVNLCMRLTQPDSIFRHDIQKLETIPGSKHSIRKTTNRKHAISGRTYALNKKNSVMCNLIFK